MNNQHSIPFVDLVTSTADLEQECMDVFRSVLRSGVAIGGPVVENFEREFANYCAAKYCVGVGSGTDALRFALMAVGVQPGDGVITTPHTFVATTEAITQSGARPHFVDIDRVTFNISTEALAEYLSRCRRCPTTGLPVDPRSGRRLTAIVPVHLYGQIVDMDRILEIAEEYGLKVVEDACQAHGAEYLSRSAGVWRRAGSIGRAAAFSFYPTKNLGACGEAGAVTTNDEHVAKMARMLRDHGQAKKYVHEVEGYNGRLDALQAGILSIKLQRLDEWNEKRRNAAQFYGEQLSDIPGIDTPREPEWVRSVYHLYVIQTAERDALQAHLTAKGIGTGLHYPIPLHLQAAYSRLGYRAGDLPVAEAVTRSILSLPMHPELTPAMQEKVVAAISEFSHNNQMLVKTVA